ncbi:MAG: CHAT domain-containing protein [Thermoanaerobaculia bacterium]
MAVKMGRSSCLLVAVLALLAIAFGLLLRMTPAGDLLPAGAVPSAFKRASEVGLGPPVERELRGEAANSHFIFLHSGDFLYAVVEQRGIDVVAELFDPHGRRLMTVDIPKGKQRPLFAVAREGGHYRIEVRSQTKETAGRYSVAIKALRPATQEDRTRAAAAGSFARGKELQARGGKGAMLGALQAYRDALRHWQSLGEKREQAAALRQMGQVAYALADLRGARDNFEAALAISRALGDREAEAPLLNDTGSIYQALSELEKAEASFLRALHLFRALGDRRGEAASLNLLGGQYASRSDLARALDAYGCSLEVWRALGDHTWEAATLHSLGRIYSLLGRTSEALDLLEKALRLRRATGNRRGEASTLLEIGWARYLSGDPTAALQLYDQSIALRRQEGDLLGEAATLDRRGTALAKMGMLDAALASYRRALEVFEQAGQPGSMAHTMANLGWLYEARGDPLSALAYEERALHLFQQSSGDRHAEAHTLFGMARAHRRMGDLALARARMEEVLSIVDSLRGEAPIQALRTSYLASRHDYYEFAIDLLMQSGLSLQAWEVSERARARSLLESVGEGSRARPIDEDVTKLLLPVRGAKSQPHDGSKAEPVVAPLHLREVQREVLDQDTLLLQYALGEEHSFLWVVNSTKVESFKLPGRRQIEELARRLYSLLPRSHLRSVRQPVRLVAEALSDAILGPAVGSLGNKRLLIAADGALQYVPFAALPMASEGGARVPLLVNHEVISVPSVSVLARLRRERADRLPPLHLAAVIADPVFQKADPRVGGWKSHPAVLAAIASVAGSGSDLERSASDVGMDHLMRLPWSRHEAEAILRLIPPSEGLRALDFAASRELVRSGRLGEYRIVHFATHGFLNAEHPDLSGLVLSLVDDRGRPQDGFLRVSEIPGLDLHADLVVLSACRTALGKEIWGEGLLGLTQAFLQGGASRVVVSLWNVDDAGTAVLMGRFYQAMLQENLPPSGALRAAQLAMLKEPRWEAPYYWAGFSLQGEWKRSVP